MSLSPENLQALIDRAHAEGWQELDLSNEGLKEIPESVVHLKDLTELNLNNNQITKIPDSIGQLTNLTELHLNENEITEIPKSIGQLSNLKVLHIYYNQIVAIPESISQLSNLTWISLMRNQITEILDSIARLSNLQHLDLGKNKIQSLPSSIKSCSKLSKLDLQGNPIPIPNIILRSYDRETILNFYFQTQNSDDRTPLHEAKLLIVGEGEAGKTTLANKLQNPDFKLKPDQDSTEGINVIQWEFDQHDGSTFRTNIWDFGGQEIYHQTHQFFLTERSLYLLVVDDRRENPNFNYWLNVIRVLTKNSPVLIIQNEKAGNKCKLNESELRREFSNLEKFFPSTSPTIPKNSKPSNTTSKTASLSSLKSAKTGPPPGSASATPSKTTTKTTSASTNTKPSAAPTASPTPKKCWTSAKPSTNSADVSTSKK